MQNGLGNLEIIAQEFGKSRTIGARVIFGAQVIRPGLVTVTVYAAPVLLGALDPELPGGKLSRVAADLNRAGIPTEVVAEIIPHLWDKVLYNCALNPLGAILGAPYGALGDDPETRDLMRLIIAEIYGVARAKGIALHHPEAAGYFQPFPGKSGAPHRGALALHVAGPAGRAAHRNRGAQRRDLPLRPGDRGGHPLQ